MHQIPHSLPLILVLIQYLERNSFFQNVLLDQDFLILVERAVHPLAINPQRFLIEILNFVLLFSIHELRQILSRYLSVHQVVKSMRVFALLWLKHAYASQVVPTHILLRVWHIAV